MFSVEEDFSIIKKQLNEVGLEKNINRIQKTILRRLGSKSRTKVRQSLRSNFKRRTGSLSKSIGYKITRNNTAIISPKDGKNMMKANVLEKGAFIRPKKGNYLTFQINGKWIRKRSITIEGRNWFHSAVDKFMKSSESQKLIEDTLYKEVDKIWKKAGKK